MAVTSVSNISITGIISVLPEQRCENLDDSSEQAQLEMEKVVASTGIQAKRVAEDGQTVLDLAEIACKALLEELDWQQDDVSLVNFVTQTPDYPLPGNAVQLQNRLGLPKSCIAFDVNLGCSGFVYGLWQTSQLLSGLTNGKALLIVGDTTTQQYSDGNRVVTPLFGDAVSVIAVEQSSEADDMVFSLGSDGAGAPYLIQPNGGAKALGKAPELFMDGMQVFVFTLREIPNSVSECLNHKGWTIADVDYCVMHQANEMMLKRLGDKLGLSAQQQVISMQQVGNTSSSSIPLAMGLSLSEKLTSGSTKLLLSGFGVGWSWGTAAFCLPALKVCRVIDLLEKH